MPQPSDLIICLVKCLMCNIKSKTRLGLTYIQFPSCSMMSGFVFLQLCFSFCSTVFSFSLPIQLSAHPYCCTTIPPFLCSSLSPWSPTTEEEKGCLFYQSSPEPEVSQCYLTIHLYNDQLLSTAIKLKQLQLPVCVWINRQANPVGYIKYCNHIPPPIIT